MRVFPLGQDRFSRQYWSLPKMGGILVEGIETSTFDELENYISEVTQKRELEIRDRVPYQNKLKEHPVSENVKNLAPNKQALDVPLNMTHSSLITKQPYTRSDPSSAQQSDSEIGSRTLVGVDTPTPEYTPNPSPPLSNSLIESVHCSPEKSFKSDQPVNHHLEKHQLPNRNTDIILTNEGTTSHSTEHQTPMKSQVSDSENLHIQMGSPKSQIELPDSNTELHADSLPWFSLLPRKQCEVLHYLQLDPSQPQQLQQQQQGMMIAPQFLGGSGYAYVAPGGAVLGQPLVQQVQMGYALVGNSLVQVPQTQYVMASGQGSGSNQLISLGNGQYALASTAGSSSVQYVSINGNQYAIMQAPDQQEVKSNGLLTTGITNTSHSHSSLASQVTKGSKTKEKTQETTSHSQTGYCFRFTVCILK